MQEVRGNTQESEHLPEPMSKEVMTEQIKSRVSRIDRELLSAFEFITSFPRSVTFFGSSRCTEGSEHYAEARRLAKRIALELRYTVLTGGSTGIMEAANRGAFEASGESVGINIKLPRRQGGNGYTTASIDVSYFFVRKLALLYAAEAYILFPGGFGTLDEFFELVTLMQTRKIRRVPIFLVGKDYWQPLLRFLREDVYEIHKAVEKSDLALYKIAESDDDIIEAIRRVPVHDGMRHRRVKELKTTS
ncbi:MAG: Rossman fold protein, TIGR00730 family [Candidatus Taylorbacteria bacterium RIFCSPHIGHO2_02_49_25]|uniref:Cytokinin riboside 5'-monophosphate phosphoribohydrolase n=1 Tax=Candidatus Taylorbacteria bacterium RIFCSPHIGHO2_02_49_25 TaxID=1802305 RepID=A0A1G2MG82_9BACT|nr:MAG: hypothetical protein UY62_C0011G0001 [Parcubacteria group bacterium GW2011_GWF2_50_9]OHA22887.1 MAG: Rossman fold protein, TIGR00730 family [Candidatus Taylorbacteria bacterium RIFCSPHIGHO2_02_49_25]OHA36298.1 MAG: Rossman fold protein, TIGR00730 family [Candidatus Taylorbacteria bacterium RIFCSPLOWO2_02_50_13]OHA40997.1 MAG: Rossman fold protein, TIGR00730 family [Candidatus Taylorbacteria bacterium RIFCSPLOWO2_02_FULL_50_120]OHA46873.1 MAG: Rossman fold protein, TIGR00730 family [Cand